MTTNKEVREKRKLKRELIKNGEDATAIKKEIVEALKEKPFADDLRYAPKWYSLLKARDEKLKEESSKGKNKDRDYLDAYGKSAMPYPQLHDQLCGNDANKAAVLTWLLYWDSKMKRPFYKSTAAMAEDIGLTNGKVRGAIDHLCKNEIIAYRVRWSYGKPVKNYYINHKLLLTAFEDGAQARLALAKERRLNDDDEYEEGEEPEENEKAPA